jgi:hypothetical protein
MSLSSTGRMRVGLLVGLLGLTTLTMGAMHTKYGRPLWKMIGVSCPIDSVTPDQVEATRQRGLDRLRGNQLAPTRPALGLKLDETTPEQALGWAKAEGLDCRTEVKGMHYVKCINVLPARIGQPFSQPLIDEVALAFNPAGKLIAVDTWRTRLTGDEASTVFERLTASLQEELGAPTSTLGEATPAYLEGGLLHLASKDFRFSNYVASVSATNLAEKGIAVREQYQSAVKPLSPRMR